MAVFLQVLRGWVEFEGVGGLNFSLRAGWRLEAHELAGLLEMPVR
jgi:hypothetical protein